METTLTGKMAWFDFPTKDEVKAMKFFKTLFNWNFVPMGPNYWMILAENETIGGLRKEDVNEAKPRHGFLAYFTVPSTNEGKILIEKSGGKLSGETVAINGGQDGYYQNFTDLDGNLLSLWSKKP